ncbi:tetratricopeptide repeat protein [candidate division KSB1 bacterium]|nr:tetratricopeptide repeat protein [candidate division KSB1 bacterium]RQW05817.1 MAG: tetratricopeptide repeat protein [candidate division KSB1 bacterium]
MLRKMVIIRGVIVVAAFAVTGITAFSFITGCTATTGGAATGSVATEAVTTKEDSLALEKYNREKNIAFSTGHEHHKNKNYRDAIKPLWKAARMDSAREWSSVYTKLADCYLKLDLPDSALITYQTALEHFPDNAFFYRSAGWLLNAKQQIPEAIDAYQKAIEYDGETVADYKNLGPLLISEDRLEEALENYQKLAELDPNDAEAQQIIASLLTQLGYDTTDIIDQKIKALEAKPEDTTLMFEIGEMLFKEQLYAESVEYFDKLLAITPEDATAHEYKGNALQNDGKFADAIKSYEKVLEIQPDNVKVICEMATCYLELGNLSRAMSVAQKAINTNSNFGLGYIVKGDVYAKAADDCIGKRERRIVNFDDKLVYEKAYNLYQLGASKDIQFADLGKRKMTYINPDIPTKEDRFMHPNQTKPTLECYSWLPW